MTLTRQLVSTISALSLVVLIGVQAIHLYGAHSTLQEQLDSLAQDTATSLGLSLGVLLRGGPDESLAETLINPVFDRGHYASIEFVSLEGKPLVRKSLDARAGGEYPDWFARMFPLSAPRAESLVTGGWRQLGKVRVEAHPRFAYKQLWQTTQATLLYLLLIYAAGLLALRLILGGVLRPLVAIERAAGAISARSFVTIEARPSTRELARVVEAMNTLSRKVGDAIAGETARWAGAQFALALPGLGGDAARQALAALQSRLSLIIGEYGPQERATVCVGAVAGELEHAGLEAIARAAQEALEGARQAERWLLVREFEPGATAPAGRDAGIIVAEALASRSVLLVGQPVMSLPGAALLHTELMARIPEGDGRVMPATQFMAIVAQQRLARRLDEAVLGRVLEMAGGLSGVRTVAINLSASSLEHAGFVEWLVRWVRSLPPGFSVAFELSEHGVVHSEGSAAALAAALAGSGAAFAIDHFGVHRNSLALVPVLKPAYVKLSSLHTRKIIGDAGTRFLVDSVVRATRQLDVPVIAQNVESDEQLTELRKLGVAGYQGYHVGAPAPWPSA